MTAEGLPESAPGEQGVDANGILALLDALDADEGQDPHGLSIVRHGHVIAQGWWAPYARETPHLLYSLSKSFTSTAAGLAAADGLIDLDAPVIDYFPEFADDIADPRSRSILVRHAASMSTGHTFDTWDRAVETDPEEPVRGFLLLPPERDPGTVFAYNQPATYTLAAIIQKVTGQTLADYLQPRLFEPLGLPAVGWQEYPPGRSVGFTGLFAATDAIARLGQLYLQRGVWGGRRILSEEWVAEATRPQIPTLASEGVTLTTPSDPDWSLGYGFQFWMMRHDGYRGDGAFGQYCLVLPDDDAVVAYTGSTVDMQRTLDLVWEHLLPAFGDGMRNDSAGAEEALRERLAGLRVAAPRASEASSAPDAAADWDGTVFTRDPDSAPGLAPETVTVSRDVDGWRVGLSDSGGRIDTRLGTAGWAVSDGRARGSAVHVAVGGGWTGPDTLRLDVIFVETPHRLMIDCDASTRTFTSRWVSEPLTHYGMTLQELQSPLSAG